MRSLPFPRPARWALLAGLLPLASPPADAGVPRSCIHPRADPIECPRDRREVLLKVIPSSRRRELAEQRPARERVGETQSLRRNQLLEEILGVIRPDEPDS